METVTTIVADPAGPPRDYGYDVRRVQVAEITPWGWARPFCSVDPQDGLWACASHDVRSFTSPEDFHVHLAAEGRHDIVWRCKPCGVPHGFRHPESKR